MRIGFDAKRYFQNRTGLGNYSRGVVHALASQFPEDEFVLFHRQDAAPELQLPNLSTFATQTGSLGRVFGMAGPLKQSAVAVFHGLSNEIPLGLKRTGIRSVVTIHDVIFRRYPDYYRLADRNIYHLKTRYAVRHADHIIATSKATADDLVAFYGARESQMTVLYQPVQEAFYQPLHEAPLIQGPYFIYVSSFTGRKNHGALLQAFASISKQCQWNLVLAGAAGETLEQVHNLVAHEGLKDRVFVYENCPRHELLNLMKHAEAFVYPSLFEGFGIPLAEAAACGIPAAVSRIPVFTELAETAAEYFHPNQADSIAEAMMRLTDAGIRAGLRQQMELIRKKTDATKIASDLMQLYRNL